ncbi:MAG: DUF1016 family protein, partial [Opitutaceae bacterium]|nr:DUF1016 family protein [Opitutaceae bacterium]
YGLEILPTLSAKLVPEFGPGFSTRNLARMISFAERFSEPNVAARLAERLGWSHLVEILALTDPLAQEFYAEMARAENWSVRTLRQQICSQLFLRTAFSKKSEPEARQELARMRETDPPSPDLVFRDPYVLRFLGLQDTLAERDMEAAIIRDMEAFILELGAGFAFLERQKRMIVGGVDHYLDLLFFHRRLRRLVAIELKLGAFTPGDKGQMELYLAWLRENEQGPGEDTPLGLVLCAKKNEETVRLLGLDRGDIRVASYIAAALPEATLRERLQTAVVRLGPILEQETVGKRSSARRSKGGRNDPSQDSPQFSYPLSYEVQPRHGESSPTAPPLSFFHDSSSATRLARIPSN